MTSDSFVTEIYHQLPSSVRNTVKAGLNRSEFLLLFRWYFGRDNYYRTKGWFESEKRGLPVDSDGNSIPWYSYPAIDFLNGKLPRDLKVFEYGSGESSLWWADRTDRVTTVEHDREWAEHVRSKAPGNLRVVHHPDPEPYVRESQQQDAEFDVVIIDGERRPACFEPAVRSLSDQGVLIVDDAHWDHIRNEKLIEREAFKSLPFYGPQALDASETCTEILYRDDNCLGI